MSPLRIGHALSHALFTATTLLAVAAASPGGVSAQALPQVATGRIERLAHFPSRHVDARHVDVWLPADYSPARRYQVLYMHDGQMLFDAATTWNKQTWDVHLAVDRLVRAGRIPPTLVVGVWNNGRFRHSEYYPQKFLPYLEPGLRESFVTRALQGAPRADAYLRFLVEELKPAIDARFSTQPGPEATFLMGSSMGALISIYALNEQPQVFGGAAGLSVHWVGTGEANAALPLAAFNYLRDHLVPPQGRRLYMDRGTTELDAIYGPYQAFIDEIVRDRGWGSGQVMSRVFEGTGHNERAWAQRLDVPLTFLLGR